MPGGTSTPPIVTLEITAVVHQRYRVQLEIAPSEPLPSPDDIYTQVYEAIREGDANPDGDYDYEIERIEYV